MAENKWYKWKSPYNYHPNWWFFILILNGLLMGQIMAKKKPKKSKVQGVQD